jgi:hypothetical protein
MCGLVGVINKCRNGFYKKQEEIFYTLLYVDFLRGPDSTGVFMVDNQGDVMIAKEASTPAEFLASREWNNMMSKAMRQGSALIGHNRKATRGEITDENAHPFWVDDKIVLAHNGTMHGDHKKHADVEVDSHAIAHIIHEKGDVEQALNSFDAAYALIWYDFEKKTLFATRNRERPLWWVETPNEWIISSEKCMLDFVIARYDLKTAKGPHEFSANDLQIFSLKNSTWEAGYRKLNLSKNYPVTQMDWPNRYQFDPDDPSCYYIKGLDVDDVRFQDVPFDTKPTADVASKKDDSVQPDNSVHAMNMLSHEFERALAKGTNKIIPNGQFYTDILKRYPRGTKVTACAFDYHYANGQNEKGGFYLYLQVYDDPDLICRLWMDEKAGEERVLQMAGTSWVYKLEVNRKWWQAFERGPIKEPTTPGLVIMECEHPELVYGGGMGDPEWAHKLTSQIVKH